MYEGPWETFFLRQQHYQGFWCILTLTQDKIVVNIEKYPIKVHEIKTLSIIHVLCFELCLLSCFCVSGFHAFDKSKRECFKVGSPVFNVF